MNGFLTFRNDIYLQRSRKPIHSPLKTLSLYIHKLQANLSYFFLKCVDMESGGGGTDRGQRSSDLLMVAVGRLPQVVLGRFCRSGEL